MGRAETLDFPPSSFDRVLFNESLHHVPAEHQLQALREACRVLVDEGSVLITEPMSGRGFYEEIEILYNDERDKRKSAEKAIRSVIGMEFNLAWQGEIPVEYCFTGFEDIYKNEIQPKYLANWNPDNRQDIIDILDRCRRNDRGYYVLDYFASVWLLTKE